MRLLAIEDNEEIVNFLVPALRKESFAVDSATDGTKGLYLAQTNNYDLIILDNSLPGKNGLEICTTLRQEGSKVPILLLSVLSETEEKISLLNAGADDYVTKPFSYTELLSRIHAILRRPRKAEETCLEIGDLYLNLTTYEVKQEGKPIYLTLKEFSLLALLIRNKGSVVSRAMILEQVWATDRDPLSKTIETHILNIRKKIGPSGQTLIKSMVGRGYKID